MNYYESVKVKQKKFFDNIHPFMIYVSFVQDPQKEKGLKIWKLLGWLCEHFLKNDKKKIESDFHADFFFLHVKHFHVWFSWCENSFFFLTIPPLFAAETKMKNQTKIIRRNKKLLLSTMLS